MPSSTLPYADVKQPLGCGLIFLIIWSAGTLTGDWFVAHSAVRQARATEFAKTSGRITESHVEQHRNADGEGNSGTSYTLKIEYTYRVAGKEYRGTRYRFGNFYVNNARALQIVDAFPVGRTVDVFYDPSDPATAVLRPGIEGADLLIATFLTPFNLTMIGLWYWAFMDVKRRRVPSIAGRAKVIDDGFTTRVRLTKLTALGLGFCLVGLGAFVGTFPIIFTRGLYPPLSTMCTVWAIILSEGLIATAYWSLKLRRGDRDLVIDEADQIVTVPPMNGRSSPLQIPIKSLRAVEVERIEKDRLSESRYYRSGPALVYESDDGAQRRVVLTPWPTHADAESLAAWLRERLRLKPAESGQRQNS